MADVVSEATRAGGLGAKQARWVFVLVWATGVWVGALEGYLSPLDPLNASAYLAGLIGAVLLTTPGSHRLPRRVVFWLPVLATYLTVISLYRASAVMNVWTLDFAAYLVAFLIPRGNPVAGSIGGGLVIGYALVWGLDQDPSGAGLVFLIGIPIGCMVAGIVWRVVLRWIVNKERAHRSAAAQATERAAASDEAVALLQRELADIRNTVADLLTGIARGESIDHEMRTRLTLAEASIRDRIRAPHLQHPLLVAELSRLRSRGVAVVVLGEPIHGVLIDTSLAERIADQVSSVVDGRVTVRSLPPGRAAAVSIVVQRAERTEQVLMTSDGRVLSRT
ncbi:hypothetical protein ACL9RL_18770 [Plantibacter sp. Mn2098]|uniref:hypothetical protein n=1 Tax=Plantibacter sp. Mn2098 TaxID=3395266 RepID=UPI003BC6655F